jgi:hypothetical protein
MAPDYKKLSEEIWKNLSHKLSKLENEDKDVIHHLKDLYREIVTLQLYSLTTQKLLEKIMSQQDDLNAIATGEETDIAAINAAIPGIQTGLNNLNTALTAALANVPPSVDLSAVLAAQADLHTALGTLQSITIPTPPPPPVVTPPVDTTVFDPGTNKAVYSFVATDGSSPDLTAWTAVADVTDASGGTLYTFDADTAGADPTGVSADWVAYTGALTTVAPPAGTTPAS